VLLLLILRNLHSLFYTLLDTGFTELNNITSGFQRGDLILLAARPSLGKTSLAFNIAQNIAQNENLEVLFFSLEMPARAIAERYLSAEAQLNSLAIKRLAVDINDSRILKVVDSAKNLPLYIGDFSSIKVEEIELLAQSYKNLGFIVIDYIQLINSSLKTENVTEQIGEISRKLKQLAKKLNIPVLALSQLSRNPELRQDKRPHLADLRSSGNLEQDADLVIMIYRDKYYTSDSDYGDIAEILIQKHRNGPTGTIELLFNDKTTKFYNLPNL
jgi:replicative DNA helicase